jgi:hypothetical protein
MLAVRRIRRASGTRTEPLRKGTLHSGARVRTRPQTAARQHRPAGPARTQFNLRRRAAGSGLAVRVRAAQPCREHNSPHRQCAGRRSKGNLERFSRRHAPTVLRRPQAVRGLRQPGKRSVETPAPRPPGVSSRCRAGPPQRKTGPHLPAQDLRGVVGRLSLRSRGLHLLKATPSTRRLGRSPIIRDGAAFLLKARGGVAAGHRRLPARSRVIPRAAARDLPLSSASPSSQSARQAATEAAAETAAGRRPAVETAVGPHRLAEAVVGPLLRVETAAGRHRQVEADTVAEVVGAAATVLQHPLPMAVAVAVVVVEEATPGINRLLRLATGQPPRRLPLPLSSEAYRFSPFGGCPSKKPRIEIYLS